MHKWYLGVGLPAVLLALCVPPQGRAEEEEQRLEIYGAYSYKSSQEFALRAEEAAHQADAHEAERERRSIHGFDTALGVRVAPRLKLLAEVSGHYGGGHTSMSDYDFLGGPQVELPSLGRTTPFAHFLAGAGRSSRRAEGMRESELEYAPALAIGGGFDYKFHKNLAWRLIQVDYNPTFTKNPAGGRTRQDDVEISFGIVLLR